MKIISYSQIDMLNYAQQFVDGIVDADTFVEEYVKLNRRRGQNEKLWREQGFDYTTPLPDPEEERIRQNSSCIESSSIFIWADNYCPDDDRESYEINAEQLKEAVRGLLKIKSLSDKLRLFITHELGVDEFILYYYDSWDNYLKNTLLLERYDFYDVILRFGLEKIEQYQKDKTDINYAKLYESMRSVSKELIGIES